MNVADLVEQLQAGFEGRRSVAHVTEYPARPARYGALQRPLHPVLQEALNTMGIERLYTHQAAAIDGARDKDNVILVTGTASGKTLGYTVPVLENLVHQPDRTALFLFPTKALAQDQLRGLMRWKEAVADLPLVAGTYDGDTPGHTRRKLREEANCILTNPDMLHSGILPRHAGWARFFSNLDYVVIDEVHTYRGIFGSNVANLMRRLKRVCTHYGSKPQFLCSSATIANPVQLAEDLVGERVKLVDDDGSPRGPKYFMLWNPRRLGETAERRSSTTEAKELMTELVRRRIQTIAFARSRVVVELLYRYVRDELQRVSPSLSRAVRAYRGGYLPSERRQIEQQLFAGDLLGVTSTNALELGIDIGGLDACIIVGFPGSIASTWQQAGRAGRGTEGSLVVLIAQNAPLDQYLMQHPDYFFQQSPEHAIVDPGNAHIVLGHLRAATFELPVGQDEEADFGDLAPALFDLLSEDGQVIWRGGRWYWTGKGYPADDVNLRNSTDATYTVVDTTGNNQVIGSTDELSAFMQLYPEAVYLHDGESYFVDNLDIVEKVAYVRKADLDYYTQAITDRRVRVEDQQTAKELRGANIVFGDVDVTFLAYMFKKIKFEDRDSIGFGKIALPEKTLETTGFWLVPPLDALTEARKWGRNASEGLLGIANVVTEVIPVFAMCDPADIGSVVDSSNTGVPTLFVFDRYSGGLGFAEKAYEFIEPVLEGCLDLIEKCPCTQGCPSCVGSPIPPFSPGDADGDAKGKIPDKEAALILLHQLLGRGQYIPKYPVPGQDGDSSVQEPPRPASKPLPERLEMRLRKQVQGLKTRRSGS